MRHRSQCGFIATICAVSLVVGGCSSDGPSDASHASSTASTNTLASRAALDEIDITERLDELCSPETTEVLRLWFLSDHRMTARDDAGCTFVGLASWRMDLVDDGARVVVTLPDGSGSYSSLGDYLTDKVAGEASRRLIDRRLDVLAEAVWTRGGGCAGDMHQLNRPGFVGGS